MKKINPLLILLALLIGAPVALGGAVSGLIPHNHSSAGKGGATLSPTASAGDASTVNLYANGQTRPGLSLRASINTNTWGLIAGGATSNGTNYIASGAVASLLLLNEPTSGGFNFYANTGLVAGNSFTPVLVAHIQPDGKMYGGASKYFGRMHQGSFSTGSLAAGALFSSNVTHGLGSDDVHVIISVAGGDNYMAVATRPDASDTIFRGGQNTTARIAGSAPAAGQVNIGIYNDAAGAVTYTVYYTIIGK